LIPPTEPEASLELKKPANREYVPIKQGKHGMGQYVRSFQERLSAFVEDESKKAKSLPPGPGKESALLKIQQAETASHLDRWAAPSKQRE
jgi:hypothetical protein